MFFLVVFFILGLILTYVMFRGQVKVEDTQDKSLLATAQVDPSAAAANADSFWIPQGKFVTIGGYDIPGGMLYVGHGLPSCSGHRVEPALINPKLPVESDQPDRHGNYMSYWPSYSEIKPASRAAYLEWLAGGRGDPTAYIGYVFLYFYGLERRLLFDASHSAAARAERSAILGEVQRLLSIYGDKGSFGMYAAELLKASMILFPDCRQQLWSTRLDLDQNPVAMIRSHAEMAMAQMIAEKRAIPVDWALVWYFSSPSANFLGGPYASSSDCRKACQELFRLRYSERFPNGMMLGKDRGSGQVDNRTPTKYEPLTYRPASASFGTPIRVSRRSLPFLVTQPEIFQPLMDFGNACVGELEAYLKFVRGHPSESHSHRAIAKLPKELMLTQRSKILPLKEWVQSLFAEKEMPIVKGTDVMTHWGDRNSERGMHRTDAVGLAQVLENLGYGMEPDVRFGGESPLSHRKVVFFCLPPEYSQSPSPEYTSATLLLRLAVAVAAVDGEVAESERLRIARHLKTALQLDAAEVTRLEAHLTWLLEAKPTLQGIKSRLQGVDRAARNSMAQFALGVAAADGYIDVSEITTLGRIYSLLGLDQDQVKSDLRALGSTTVSPATDPVSVSPAGYPDQGFRVPPKPSEVLIKLDKSLVEAKMAETATVSRLLASIFSEGETLPKSTGSGVDQAAEHGTRALDTTDTAASLDRGCCMLLRAIAGHHALSRVDFEILAEGFDVLPDGAIEAINEAAFGTCGQPAFEGEDPIEVNHNAIQAILS